MVPRFLFPLAFFPAVRYHGSQEVIIMNQISIQPIARMHSDFPTKFGIPRQSNLVENLRSTIVFEPQFRNADALRGMDGFSHLWIIWQFSEAVRTEWSPTVRPPRLGGNTRMGVFATRSPFRPNNLGLSCVRFEGIEMDPELGPVIHVSGADLMDGTPIFDIKPYIPYADSHPDALGGFTDTAGAFLLQVNFPEELLALLPEDKREAAIGVLSHDPRPSYQRKPDRIYGLPFAGFDIRFRVEDDRGPSPVNKMQLTRRVHPIRKSFKRYGTVPKRNCTVLSFYATKQKS